MQTKIYFPRGRGREIMPNRRKGNKAFQGHKELNMGTPTSQLQVGQSFPIAGLPDDLLELVLSKLPGSFLIHTAQLVCKHWKQIIDFPSMWKMKCLDEFPCLFEKLGKVPDDIRSFYFNNPLTKNLIKNAHGLEKLKHWETEGYCDFEAQTCFPTQPPGSDILAIPGWTGGEMKCWATSYMWCVKKQKIDLIKEGCTEFLLDEIRPDIDISEWYAARFDCGCVFILEVNLLAADGTTVIDDFTGEWRVEQWKGREWHQVSHKFTGYKPGVRFIEYTHKGKDTQFWAGHYGPKFTGASVRFNFRN